MFFFSKKTTIAASGILQGATDHHSHILPGVDDGVETMDEALHILATYEAAGVKTLWLTPHIMEDIPNTPQKLEARFLELKAAYTGSIELHLAAEYMIDNHLRKLLQEAPPRFRGEVVEDRRGEEKTKECPQGSIVNQSEVTEGSKTTSNKLRPALEGRWHEQSEVTEGSNNKLLPIGSKGNHLLVETSYFNPPMRFRETLRQIKSLGYHPLLAHPERYMYMDNDEYQELHDEGVRFQLNLPSLCGAYGNTVKKKAEWLLSNGLYSVAGSDLHCEDAITVITGCKMATKSIGHIAKILNNKI